MNIKKLTIKNFRSIGSEGLTVEFNTNLTAIVGKNNVGKSNILTAINYVLGGYWPYDGLFSLEDFYQKNVNNDIEICVYFSSPIEYSEIIEGWFEYKVKVHGFKLEYKTYKRDTSESKKGDLHLDFNCINQNGDIIRIPTLAPKKGRSRKEFLSSFTKILKVTRKLKNQINVIYIPIQREISKFSPSNSKSLLGSLLKTIKDRFEHDPENIKISDELSRLLDLPQNTTRSELFEAYINKANETLKTDDLILISDSILKYLKEHIGEERTKDLQFEFNVQDTWSQFKNIELVIENNGVKLPAHRFGNGFQSLMVISIFRTYLELKEQNAIFLIEEPEMFLHTHAKKYFYSILQNLSKNGIQIIYTTHATEFVNILDAENVKRVIIENQSTKILPEKSINLNFNEDDLLKLNTAINNERAELFFADKVILVEGETEKVVFDYLLNLKGVDPNLNDISIIETSGKGSIPRYIKLLESLDIPFVVVFDSDILQMTDDGEKNKKIIENNNDAKRKNENIEQTISDKSKLFINEPYLEVVAGMTDNLTKKKESKPLKAIEYFKQFDTYEDVKKVLPLIVAPIENLLG